MKRPRMCQGRGGGSSGGSIQPQARVTLASACLVRPAHFHHISYILCLLLSLPFCSFQLSLSLSSALLFILFFCRAHFRSPWNSCPDLALGTIMRCNAPVTMLMFSWKGAVKEETAKREILSIWKMDMDSSPVIIQSWVKKKKKPMLSLSPLCFQMSLTGVTKSTLLCQSISNNYTKRCTLYVTHPPFT